MKIAILESIIMPAGHEVEFDRILVNEVKRSGDETVFFVPENFPFKIDYKTDVSYLSGGEVVTYAGVGPLKKLWLSILREKRRRAWFNSAYDKAMAGECDAIIIPTATYRYVKAIVDTKLKDSPVPVYIIFHGINNKEQANFVKAAKLIASYKNIYLKVITLCHNLDSENLDNVDCIIPPVFKPVHISKNSEYTQDVTTNTEPATQGDGIIDVSSTKMDEKPLTLGVFGQFRKEKNIIPFLDAFIKAQFNRPVNLVVQGATAKPEDSQLFEEMQKNYEQYDQISFVHKSLIGPDWERALLDVDVIVLPYGAKRYLYHWSAMLFTAIGFNKCILQSREINPEVLEKYPIGAFIDITDVNVLQRELEQWVQEYTTHMADIYQALECANHDFGHEEFVTQLLR